MIGAKPAYCEITSQVRTGEMDDVYQAMDS